MKNLTVSQLRSMQIVNVCNGEVLGTPDDFDIRIDGCSAEITALTVGRGGIFNFGKKNEITIPWQNVECVGEDAILVRIPPDQAGYYRKKL